MPIKSLWMIDLNGWIDGTECVDLKIERDVWCWESLRGVVEADWHCKLGGSLVVRPWLNMLYSPPHCPLLAGICSARINGYFQISSTTAFSKSLLYRSISHRYLVPPLFGPRILCSYAVFFSLANFSAASSILVWPRGWCPLYSPLCPSCWARVVNNCSLVNTIFQLIIAQGIADITCSPARRRQCRVDTQLMVLLYSVHKKRNTSLWEWDVTSG